MTANPHLLANQHPLYLAARMHLPKGWDGPEAGLSS